MYNYNFIENVIISESLASDAERVGTFGFPQLLRCDAIPKGETLPFQYITSTKNLHDKWFHFFVDDTVSERVWKNFNRYKDLIRSASGLISTDFSIFRDYPEDVQIINCFKNRAVCYAMQKINRNTVPTAGFGGENTWKWCFDGLPENSAVAITTNGTLSDPEARRLFVGGIDALIHTVNPKNLVVCGKYPEWLNAKYPDVRITGILSYGQIWNGRKK